MVRGVLNQFSLKESKLSTNNRTLEFRLGNFLSPSHAASKQQCYILVSFVAARLQRYEDGTNPVRDLRLYGPK